MLAYCADKLITASSSYWRRHYYTRIVIFNLRIAVGGVNERMILQTENVRETTSKAKNVKIWKIWRKIQANGLGFFVIENEFCMPS